MLHLCKRLYMALSYNIFVQDDQKSNNCNKFCQFPDIFTYSCFKHHSKWLPPTKKHHTARLPLWQTAVQIYAQRANAVEKPTLKHHRIWLKYMLPNRATSPRVDVWNLGCSWFVKIGWLDCPSMLACVSTFFKARNHNQGVTTKGNKVALSVQMQWFFFKIYT